MVWKSVHPRGDTHAASGTRIWRRNVSGRHAYSLALSIVSYLGRLGSLAVDSVWIIVKILISELQAGHH